MPPDFKKLKQPFDKPPTTTDQQLELLRSRGLFVPNAAGARSLIERVSYAKLGGYFYLMELPPVDKKRSHRFKANATFADVEQLYALDQQVSDILLPVLFAIELAMRSRLSDFVCMATGSAFWHYKQKGFRAEALLQKDSDTPSVYNSLHHQFISLIQKNENVNFVRHHLDKYQTSYKLPFWLLKELLSFDKVIQIYVNLETQYQKIIAKGFPGTTDQFTNYLRFSSYMRNLCAHNGRLIGTEYIHKVAHKSEIKHLLRNTFIPKPNWELPSELKTAIIVIHLMSNFFKVETDFIQQLENLLMGFDRNDDYLFLKFDKSWFTEIQEADYSAGYRGN